MNQYTQNLCFLFYFQLCWSIWDQTKAWSLGLEILKGDYLNVPLRPERGNSNVERWTVVSRDAKSAWTGSLNELEAGLQSSRFVSSVTSQQLLYNLNDGHMLPGLWYCGEKTRGAGMSYQGQWILKLFYFWYALNRNAFLNNKCFLLVLRLKSTPYRILCSPFVLPRVNTLRSEVPSLRPTWELPE